MNWMFIYKSDKFKGLRVNCKEATRLLSEQLEHPLPLHKRVLLGIHLSVCKACENFGKQTKAIKGLVGKKFPKDAPLTDPSTNAPASLSDEARSKMKDRLRKS